MLNNSSIAKLGKYILTKNEAQRHRQRARGKVNYYKNILAHLKNKPTYTEPRGLSKWKNTSNAISKLKMLIKFYKIEQLKSEIKLSELVLANKKELRKISKELGSNIYYQYESISHIKLADGTYLSVQDLEPIVMNQDIEDILLKGAS